MYISPKIIRIICAALWIGAIAMAFHSSHEPNMSADLKKFINILALVMAAIGFIVGSIYGLFPGE